MYSFLPTLMWIDGNDDDKKKEEPEGGPEAGNYTPPEDLPVPGESKALPDSEQ